MPRNGHGTSSLTCCKIFFRCVQGDTFALSGILDCTSFILFRILEGPRDWWNPVHPPMWLSSRGGAWPFRSWACRRSVAAWRGSRWRPLLLGSTASRVREKEVAMSGQGTRHGNGWDLFTVSHVVFRRNTRYCPQPRVNILLIAKRRIRDPLSVLRRSTAGRSWVRRRTRSTGP